ncbi:MAG TPA: hypothetical protein VGL05_19365 [Kribbella sp.]
MTTIERPYWPHSNPEPPDGLYADLSASPVYTAHAPSECLNGCESQQSSPASKVHCEPGKLLCPKCVARLDKWLRAIPDTFALLPAVVMHGTVPSDPGTKHTKRPDPPAPMRLEVIDLLDRRPGYGALGILHSWAELVRDERGDARPEVTTVAGECATLIVNLAWCAGQEFAGDLYQEIRVLARTLDDTVGEYRPKPVGKCAALIDVPDTTVQALCGGALVMDREGTGVHCLTCGARHEANDGLRQLGLIVDSMFRHNRVQEAS